MQLQFKTKSPLTQRARQGHTQPYSGPSEFPVSLTQGDGASPFLQLHALCWAPLPRLVPPLSPSCSTKHVHTRWGKAGQTLSCRVRLVGLYVNLDVREPAHPRLGPLSFLLYKTTGSILAHGGSGGWWWGAQVDFCIWAHKLQITVYGRCMYFTEIGTFGWTFLLGTELNRFGCSNTAYSIYAVVALYTVNMRRKLN